MSDGNGGKPPMWFWIAGALALIWNLMGVMAYVAQVSMGEEALAQLPEAERALYEGVPAWATAAFAIAVFAGALGCLALLLRRAWAVPLFVVSLIGALVQNFYWYALSGGMQVAGSQSLVMSVIVIGVCVLLIWLARRSRDRGWIR